MATKKTGPRGSAVKKPVMRHARLELPDADYRLIQETARHNGLSLAAYVRMAVLQRVRRDQAEMEGGGR